MPRQGIGHSDNKCAAFGPQGFDGWAVLKGGERDWGWDCHSHRSLH